MALYLCRISSGTLPRKAPWKLLATRKRLITCKAYIYSSRTTVSNLTERPSSFSVLLTRVGMPETPCTIQSCELSEFFWSFLPGQRPGKLLCFSEKRMHVHGTWHIRRELIMDKRKRITFEYQFFFQQTKEQSS